MEARRSQPRYRRHWGISPTTRYQLGQCASLVNAIGALTTRPGVGRGLVDGAMARGAVATTGIAGLPLDEHGTMRSAAGRSPHSAEGPHAPEVKNLIDAMAALLDEIAAGDTRPVDAHLLRRLHGMVGDGLGDRFAGAPGQFREESAGGPYSAPRADEVGGLVDGVFTWLQREFSTVGHDFGRAVVRALVTHVYVLWIRPFADGNGRAARLLETYVLAAAGSPAAASHLLTEYYAETRDEYFRQLDLASRDRSLTSFIAYAVEGLRDGLQRCFESVTQAHFEAAWRSFVLDRFTARDYRKKSVFRRRRDLMLAIPAYRSFTMADLVQLDPRLSERYGELSARTRRRDLAVLVDAGLLLESEGVYSANTDALRRHARPPPRDAGTI